MQENRDWQNRGSGEERRGGAAIVSRKMVWLQLIRLDELWLSNERPPLWQSSHYAVNHEHMLIRFSIASFCHNQIKEQIIRMEPKQDREGGERKSWKLCGEVSCMCEHCGSQDSLRVSLHQKMCFRHFHTVSAWPTVCLSDSVSLQQKAPSKTS